MKTKSKKQEVKEINSMMGWIIALSPLWYIIVIRISQLTWHSNVLKYIPIDIILCIIDRELLKKQDVWKKGKIAWGWCLLSPVYLYKRTKLLKENMLKFWIYFIPYIFAFIIGFVSSFYLSYTSYMKAADKCINELLDYGVYKNTAVEACICIVETNDINSCFHKYKINIKNAHLTQAFCIKKWTEYAGLERHKAEQICECSAFEEESVCLDKYGILIND